MSIAIISNTLWLYKNRQQWSILLALKELTFPPPFPPHFLEVVSRPILSLDTIGDEPKEIKLSCTFTVIKPDPADEVHVYFYRDGKKLQGTARSEKRPSLVVLDKAGVYHCRARMPSLNLNVWSEPKNHR